MKVVRWFKARLYRMMMFSHIAILLFFLIANAIFFRVAYGSHIKQLFGQRFTRQTALRFGHLKDRLLPLHKKLKLRAARLTNAPTTRPRAAAKKNTAKAAVTPQRLLAPAMPTLRNYVRESAILLGAVVSVKVADRCIIEAAPVKACLGTPWVCRLPSNLHTADVARDRIPARVSAKVAFREPKTGRCSMLRPPRRRRRTPHWRTTYTYKLPTKTPMTVTFHWLYPVPHKHIPLVFFSTLLIFFVIIALLAMPMSRQITRPLRELTETVEQIQRGDLSQPLSLTASGEVGELARSVEHMRQALLELNRQRIELIADLSHEIRTPLTRIRNVAECVADGLMRDNLEQTMEGVCHQVDEVNHLLGDLLDIARFDLPDKRRLERSTLNPETLLREVHHHFAPNAQTEGSQLLLNVPETPLPSVHADHHRLKQVFANLLENAIRYSPSGGTIVLSACKEEEGVRFEVKDDGPGISPEHREKVFERLFRIDPSRARQTGGQGLGLAIVKQIVEAHDGHVGVSESKTGGALFWFVIPTSRS